MPEITKFIYELHRLGISRIFLSGGLEFLSSPYAHDVIELLVKLNFNITLLTNGTLLKKEYFETYIDCENIRISMDTLNKKIYGIVRGSNNQFDSLIDNVTSLIKLRNKTNSKLKIGASLILNKYTIGTLDDFLVKATSYGFDYVTVKDNFFEEKLNRESFNLKAKKIISDFKLKTNSELKINLDLHPMKTTIVPFKKCYLMESVIVMDPFGNIYPCCTSAHPINISKDKLIGNIRDINFNLELLHKKSNVKINPLKDCSYCSKWDYEFNLLDTKDYK